MAADIWRALREIEAGLGRLARPTTRLLNPGIDPHMPGALLAPRGLTPPGDLATLWQWRNGNDTSTHATLGELWLVPGFYLLSVEDAIGNLNAFAADPRWNPGWLPVLADGGGDFLSVGCLVDDLHGAVHHFRIDQSEQPLEYLSVERMVATFAAAFTRGAFFVDGEGHFEQDADAYAAIAAELNPGVRWWTDPVR